MAEDEKKDDLPETHPTEKTSQPDSNDEGGGDGGDGDGDTESSSDSDADEAAEVDAASPEAIAKRVAALGEEDEADRIARLEEEKLAERRERQRKGRGKKGLETAASKRLSRIGEGAKKRSREDDARKPAPAVAADPLIEKTAQLSRWAKKNQKFVGWIVAAGLVVAAGFGGFSYLQNKKNGEAATILSEAVVAQSGRIGDPAKAAAEDAEHPERPKDPTPIFKTTDERRDAALAKYREVQSRFPGSGAALLARLDEAALLLDKKDSAAALAAFNDVSTSALAQVDVEVKGRALEGIGFVQEQKGDTAEALKAFRELENTDVKGFKELGMYHQARVLEAKGDKDKAQELLKSIHERLTKPGEGHPFPYLEQIADDRLRNLDPSALPPKQAGHLGGMGGGGSKMSEAQMRQAIEQLKKQMQEHPEHP